MLPESKISTAAHWEKEVLYSQGDVYFRELLQAIEAAKYSIELESYIFEKGILADRLSKSLIAAARRGLRVRLIVDGWGSQGFIYDYLPQFRASGVRVRFFRVIPWILKRLPGEPKSTWQRLLLRLRTANRGNHRKFCLIDHAELWVGSFNISDVHLREVHGDQAWKDAGVCVRGPELKHARQAFQRAYRGWIAVNLPARSPKLLLLNDTFLHKRRARIEQLDRIRGAATRIWLATPYFVPVGQLFRILKRKAREGVDVRLIVPEKNDIWFIKWLSLPIMGALAKRGVRIFIFSPRFSHQKLCIADDFICVGSTNLNHRSYLHDLEMDVVITHADNKTKILEGYIRDQSLSRPFTEHEWVHLPIHQKLFTSIFLVGKYWS